MFGSTARTDRQWFLLLSAAYLAMAGVHLVWSALAQRMPTFDQAAHLTKGLAFADAIRHGHFLREFWSIPMNYPPLHHILIGIGALLVGSSPSLGLYVNLVALGVTMMATFVLGRQLVSPRAGLMAAVLVALYPGVATYSREALQEPLLTALAATSIALLVATQLFRNRGASLWLGLVMGLGFLVKPSFGFYLWLPVVCVGLLALRRVTRAVFLNLVTTAAVTIGVAALWYWPHRLALVALQQANRADALALGNTPDLWQGFLSLWQVSALGLMTYFGQYVACGALVLGAIQAGRRLWLLHAWILGTWGIVVSAIVFRDDKLLLAAVPAMAILVAAALDGVRTTWMRVAAVAVVFGTHILAFASAEFGRPDLAAVPWLQTQSQYAGMGGAEPSLSAIVDAMTGSGTAAPSTVAVVPNEPRINANTLIWQASRAHASLAFEHISVSGYYTDESAFRRAATVDWVLLKTGAQGFPGTVDLADGLNTRVRSARDLFNLVGSFPLADGSQAEVYRVTAPVIPSVTDAQIQEVVAGSDPDVRGLIFGDRFLLLGVTMRRNTEGFYDTQGVVLRLAWEAMVDTPLDRLVGVHLVDDAGTVLEGADYPQNSRGGVSVAKGTRWIDERLLQIPMLKGATGLGLCLYHLTEPHLPIDRGPRDWGGVRLRIPLPQRATVRRHPETP